MSNYSQFLNVKSIFDTSMTKCIKMSTNKAMFGPVVLDIARGVLMNSSFKTYSCAYRVLQITAKRQYLPYVQKSAQLDDSTVFTLEYILHVSPRP